jgi:hypothetical protein
MLLSKYPAFTPVLDSSSRQGASCIQLDVLCLTNAELLFLSYLSCLVVSTTINVDCIALLDTLYALYATRRFGGEGRTQGYCVTVVLRVQGDSRASSGI